MRETPPPEDSASERPDSATDGDHSFTLAEGGLADSDLSIALRRIADHLPPAPDPMPEVLRRAGRIKRRRRVVRASASTAVLVAGALLGPTLADRIEDFHRADEVVAAPPAAVVDLSAAYPATTEPPAFSRAVQGTGVPVNALSWPSRGVPLPSGALDLARSYLLTQAREAESKAAASAPPTAASGSALAGSGSALSGSGSAASGSMPSGSMPSTVPSSPTPSGSTSSGAKAVVTQVWAQLEPNRTSWLYVIEGWTVGAKGTSAAQLMTGEYTPNLPAAKGSTTHSTQMTLFSAPVRFTHPIPGTSADPEASARVAEFSIWLPGSNRLLVLGAPQVKTVYYAKDGKKYVEEPTSDGVALFPRTKSALHGQPAADLVQVRDARDRALTPPVGWSTPDLSLTGSGAVYVTGEGWTGLQAVAPSLLGLATPVPTQAPTTHPSPTPPRSGMPSKGTGTPSQSPTGPSPAPISDPAPGSVPGTTGTPTDSGTTSSPAALSPTGLSGPVAW